MGYKREEGGVQPGINWWRFTIRIPGVHVKVTWPEVIQGGLIATATGGAVAPLMMAYFDVPFEVAWTVMFIQIFWVWSHTFLFGEPYGPGWITPALPLILVFLGGFTPGAEAVKAMTALTVCVSAIFLFFGITKLGGKFFQWIPVELRAGIIMGSAIAAFNSEFDRIQTMPYTLSVVWGVVFLLMFSVWFSKIRAQSKFFNRIASMALLVGFLVAALVGPLSGEVAFNIQSGISLPQFGPFLQAVSPFYVGWPDWAMYMKALPLAVMIYIVVFGDLLIADTLLKDADRIRTDEKIIIDPIRSHFATAFRNLGHLLSGGVFIPLHGPVWTGVTVFIVERYKEGRETMDSIYSGTVNWYWLAFPLMFLTPVVTFMMPILPVALSITLILTGFACAYISMRMVDTPTGRGYAVFIGLLTATFGPAYGMVVGIGLFFLLLVQRRQMIAMPYDMNIKK
ncbi:hypothetical protein [Dethiobacter alkaliphilus]|uniref:hypothetical protein n=1 Tax=Dethiobacter alkaliphilus TaxID=427926 RepID=UPI0022266D1D|nr:hypothetical protein [Dethiobacter alkaliphilus]MCW3490359.1 hypothetical protein [Dethiobacter alkaliphilus]